MRPCCLTLQAFGPFAGREVIDFTRLPVDALFLIHGPTGAGKSTLLDGICYALYGETSGDERQPKEMRSHHAANTVQTEVELEFDLGAKRYRVRRTPEQERAAAKATLGAPRAVKVTTKAELHQWNGSDWTLLASKTGDVSQRIAALLGFAADQFRQVIMLPQGQFRRLLAADSKDREKILEMLFATETYKRLQDRLQTSAQALKARAADAESRRATLLQQAGVADDEALARVIAEGQTELAALASDAAGRRTAAEYAQAALSAAEVLAGKFTEREAAQHALAKLAAADAAINADRQRHAAALQAQQVIPAWSAWRDATTQHQDAVAQAAQATNQADLAQQRATVAATALVAEERQAPQREAAARALDRLEESRANVVRLDEAAEKRQVATGQRDTLAKEVATLEQQLQAHAQQRAVLVGIIEPLAPLAGRVEALELESARQHQRLRTRQQIADSESAIEHCQQLDSKAQAALAAAQQTLDTARHAQVRLDGLWRVGQAAVLASYLVAGAPCAVCGSHDHPHPAQATGDLPTEAQLAQAAEQVTQAERAMEKSRTAAQSAAQKLTAAEATLKAQREAFGVAADAALPTVIEVTTDMATVKIQYQEAMVAAVDLRHAREQLASCEQQHATAQQAVETARIRLNEATAQALAEERVWSERAALVPEALRQPAALEQSVARARAALEALTQRMQQAQLAHQQAQSQQAAATATRTALTRASEAAALRLQAAQVALDEALAQQGFADVAAFSAARLTAEALARLALNIQQHDQSLAAARERLARAAAAVADVQAPHLDELQAALAAAKMQLEAVLARQHTLTEQVNEKSRTAAMLQQIGDELGDIASRYQVLGSLADIANGRNGANLTFQRYILASLLDEVLRQASLRLRKMTGGRYTLQRYRDVSDKRRAAGLDIEVFDEQTGSSRSANTLSGGEGFMASLALALGLSDVVQSQAGGIQLDTLFIDEGFGTLDPESLDMALNALIELQQKGRLVGIISHVDELKQQLEHGIEVRFAAGGSRVRVGAIAI